MKRKKAILPGAVVGKSKMSVYFSDWVIDKIREHFPSKRFSENIEKSLVLDNGWVKPKEK